MDEINKSEIEIYRAPGGPELAIRFEGETFWMSLQQMATLFGRDKSVISRHIKNIYKDAELSQKSVVAFFATTGPDGKTYRVEHFSLDMAISVGYRVSSRQGTQFRIWATQRLNDYLLKGYAINERRLKESGQVKLRELEGANRLLRSVIESRKAEGYERELLSIITDYTATWLTLQRYDEGTLEVGQGTRRKAAQLKSEDLRKIILKFKARLISRGEAGSLFGQETGGRFEAALKSVDQTFGGKDLYVSLEEKAAHLLYFLIKDHPFADGNKRIASLVFLLYLLENRLLMSKKGERRVNDSTLAALALLVAESKPDQRDVMCALVASLLTR